MDEILASIRRILAEDAGAPAPPRTGEPADVLDLTEAIAEDGTIRHIPPAVLRVDPPSDAQPLPAAARVEPEVSRPRVASDGPRGDGSRSDGPRIVSDGVSEAVTASFARLAGASRDAGGLGEGKLEAIVQDMLRPMLQAWLDEHLPPLVERLVRAEIARVAGQNRPGAP